MDLAAGLRNFLSRLYVAHHGFDVGEAGHPTGWFRLIGRRIPGHVDNGAEHGQQEQGLF